MATLRSFQKSQISQSSMINIKSLSLPCRYHPDEICLNYCIEQKCFQALCSECIEEHLLHHKKTGLNDLYVKSFKSVRNDCSIKLIKIIEKLLSNLTLLSQPKNPQQMLQSSGQHLQSIRRMMHQIIDQQFAKIHEQIKHKISEQFATVKQLNEIHENLMKIINQLKEHNVIITEGIVDQQVSVTDSIEKTLMLNEQALMDMFQKEAWKYEEKFKGVNVEVLFSQNEFRQATLGSLKIGTGPNGSASQLFKNNMSKVSNFGTSPFDDMGSRLRSRSKSPINQKFAENTFNRRGNPSQINYPVLHYFQTGQNILHLIDIKDQPVKSSISLGNFKIPTFHASLLSQKTGSILISGGNIQTNEVQGKSSIMSKYSLISSQFKKDFAEVKPRSSHTLCQDFFTDCVYILGGYGQTVQVVQDDSLTMFENSVERVNLKNGSVEEVAQSNWGGACLAVMSNTLIIKACMEGIEVYDSVNNFWSQITNIKGTNVEGVFCRGAGYSLLGPNAILIYGGYDQSQESRKQCYLMNLNLNLQQLPQSSIQVQRINAVLPIAEGFWNNPGIYYKNYLWAIQNVQDEEGLPIERERTLLKFDLQAKKWSIDRLSKKR